MNTSLPHPLPSEPPAPDRHRVLVVDDSPDNLALMRFLLKDDYDVRLASHGEAALKLAATVMPDIIVLDVMMPEIDGYEVCRRLKADPLTAEIPVIFLSARTDHADEALGFASGAVDYIYKPIFPPICLARIRGQLSSKETRDRLQRYSAKLEHDIEAKVAEVIRAQEATILALAALAETRDASTGTHLLRTQHYVLALAQRLRHHEHYCDWLTDSNIALLFKSAPLHDIGKVGIADAILCKPGRLTAEEFEQMKQHTIFGASSLAKAEQLLGAEIPFLKIAKEVALHHHERWDGTGYPAGLRGEAIPISARLMAVADVYDALITPRTYKPAMPHSQARELIVRGRGTHFDPTMVDAFLACEPEFLRISEHYGESASAPNTLLPLPPRGN